jgi:hypothetical protein
MQDPDICAHALPKEGHMDERALRIELDSMRGQQTLLFADSLALQLVLGQLLGLMHDRPDTRAIVEEAFDNAAAFAERLSVQHGRQFAPVAETSRMIEQLRDGAIGRRKTPNEV